MKKNAFVTGLPVAFAVILAALGALCGAVVHVATDEAFYLDESRLAVARYLGREIGEDGLTELDETAVTKYVGLTREEQREFAEQVSLFIRMPLATFENFDILNERERQHMRDVRDLIVHAERVARAFMSVATALAVAGAWTGAGLKRRKRVALLGALAGFGALALIAGGAVLAMNTSGFERLFVLMHETLFTNDLWLLNPSTDVLIRMMPQPLFERALALVLAQAGATLAVTLALLAASHLLVCGMIQRNLTGKVSA